MAALPSVRQIGGKGTMCNTARPSSWKCLYTVRCNSSSTSTRPCRTTVPALEELLVVLANNREEGSLEKDTNRGVVPALRTIFCALLRSAWCRSTQSGASLRDSAGVVKVLARASLSYSAFKSSMADTWTTDGGYRIWQLGEPTKLRAHAKLTAHTCKE